MDDWLLKTDDKFKYMLLDRMRSDCKYYIYSNDADCLWAETPEHQINIMKELWNYFPEDKKPLWLTINQINEFAKKMGVKI